MPENKMNLESHETFVMKLACGSLTTMLVLLMSGMLLVFGLAEPYSARAAQPQTPSRTFATPGEAASALFDAAQKQDEQALEAILCAGKDVTSTGDVAEDKLEHEQFTQKYQEMHRLVREADGNTVLYIGAENWPFPVPLVSKNGRWYFDSDSGKQEILARRVGENEAAAIQVCQEFVTAAVQGDPKAASEDPIAQFVENLSSGTTNNESTPFHGYYFRVVTGDFATRASAGKRPRGVALVAYPADYRGSGIMTFVVTRRGVIYQKDLGPNTTTVAPELKSHIGSDWRPAV
jgi:hypothetical protein